MMAVMLAINATLKVGKVTIFMLQLGLLIESAYKVN